MAKYGKKIFISIIAFIFVALIVTPIFATPKHPYFYDFESSNGNFSYVNDMVLESSRFTQYKPLSQDQLDTYEDSKLSYTEDELNLMGYEHVLTHTNGSELWFESRSFSVIVIDEFGYMWSSRAEWQDTLNSTPIVRRRMLSGLSIQYVNSASVKSGTVVSAPILDVTQAVFKNFDDENPEDAIYSDKIRPYIIDRNQSARVDVDTSVSNHTLTAKVNYKTDMDDRPLNIKFDVEMTLTDKGLSVLIPQSSIVESHVTFRLLSINLFRYFGATLTNNQPGYFVIPEGVGALARFDRLQSETMSANYYTTDFGFTNDRQAASLGLPFYGIVHLEGAHAMYAYLKQGTNNTSFQARLYEANTFNSAFNTYQVRSIFNRPIDRSGRTIEAILETTYPENYEVEYRFLANEDASYVGVAKDYRDQLKADDILVKKAPRTDIPILLSYIMSDKEDAFIGTKTIHMTSLEDVTNIYNYFKENGITNQQSILRGWSNDGFVNRAPYKVSPLESRQRFNDLSDLMKADNNHILLDNDYVSTTSIAPRTHNDNHTMKSLSRIRYEYTISNQDHRFFFLKPEVSLAMAQNDVTNIQNLGVSGLYSPTIGHSLFSSYEDRTLMTKSEALLMYQEILNLYDVNYLSRPNANLYAYMDAYVDMPTTNKQFTIYTDLVPILPIVLKGSVDYYGNHLNFNAMGNQRLLQMIDYSMSPSYILTMNDTYQMRYTMASRFFSTTFSNYQDEIVETYALLNDALSDTTDAYFKSREVLAKGVIKNTYDKDGLEVIIYINYTTQTQNIDGVIIRAEGFEVVS